jgi:aminopeptidase N
MAIGDDAFFTVLRTWASEQARQAVTTPQFIDLAERISGQDLGALFDEWLYTGAKPAVAAPAVAAFGLRSASTSATPRSTLKDSARR